MNNKGADQPAHPRNLISAFVVRCLDSNEILQLAGDTGRRYISTGIAEIYSSSTIGSDIHNRMLATMVLLTFLLKCCMMTQQEGIMQVVYTFAGTDQCQLPEYGPYSYICKSI